MSTFKVSIEKKQHVTGFVVVEAEDEDDATDKAQEMLDKHDDEIRWNKEASDDESGLAVVYGEEIAYRYTNKYKHCGESWEDDKCDSMHNDKCPKCNKEIEPYESIDNANGDVVDHIGKEAKEARNKEIIRMAMELYDDEGTLEIDDEPKISEVEPGQGGDNGAYVQAWAWVSFAGTELSKEACISDDPGFRLVHAECACEECGNNFFEGDKAFAVPDDVIDMPVLKWYCDECIPAEFKPKKPKKPKKCKS